MSKCSAKFVAALFVSVLAGANLATVTDLRAQAATADDCLTAPKGATSAGQPLVLPHRSRDQTSMLVPSGRDRQGQRQVHPRHAAGFTAGDFGGSRGAGRAAAAAYDHAQSDLRRARRIDLPAIPRRADSPCQSRATNDRRSDLHTSRSGQQAQHRRECARADPAGHDAMARWLGHECFKQPCRCPYRRRRRSARRPDRERCSTGLQQPALQQPAPGIALAAADASTAKPTASLQMLLAGDGCRACAGRHHGEPRLQAGPHPRAARHAPSTACDVGSAKTRRPAPQTRSAPPTRSAQPTRSAPPTRSTPPMRSAPPTFHREEARTRRAEAAHHPRPQEARPRPQDARERQVTDMLARLARSAQP